MKKVLSLSALFTIIILGACSVSPKSILNDLNGSWTGVGRFDTRTFLFGDKTCKIDSTTTLTLVTDPKTITLGENKYVVYSDSSSYYAFRADGSSLYSSAGQSLQEVKNNYEAPNGELTATR